MIKYTSFGQEIPDRYFNSEMKSSFRNAFIPKIYVQGTDSSKTSYKFVIRSMDIISFDYKRSIDYLGRELPHIEFTWKSVISPVKIGNVVNTKTAQNIPTGLGVQLIFDYNFIDKSGIINIVPPIMYLSEPPTIQDNVITWKAMGLLDFITGSWSAYYPGVSYKSVNSDMLKSDIDKSGCGLFIILNMLQQVQNNYKDTGILFRGYLETIKDLYDKNTLPDTNDSLYIDHTYYDTTNSLYHYCRKPSTFNSLLNPILIDSTILDVVKNLLQLNDMSILDYYSYQEKVNDSDTSPTKFEYGQVKFVNHYYTKTTLDSSTGETNTSKVYTTGAYDADKHKSIDRTFELSDMYSMPKLTEISKVSKIIYKYNHIYIGDSFKGSYNYYYKKLCDNVSSTIFEEYNGSGYSISDNNSTTVSYNYTGDPKKSIYMTNTVPDSSTSRSLYNVNIKQESYSYVHKSLDTSTVSVSEYIPDSITNGSELTFDNPYFPVPAWDNALKNEVSTMEYEYFMDKAMDKNVLQYFNSNSTDKKYNIEIEIPADPTIETRDMLKFNTGLKDDEGNAIYKKGLVTEINLSYTGALKETIFIHEVQ